MSLTDTFQKLKLNIIGTKTTDIDAKLDKAVRDIVSYKSNSGRNGYIDLVRSLISKEVTANGLNINGGSGAAQVTPAAMGQGSRLARYKMYETIVSHINYCFRGLRVLVDNILAPDDITKTSLEITPKKFLEDETPSEAKTGQVKETIKKLKLENNLDLLVCSTLKYGDFFVEIADEKTALTSRAYLAESTFIRDLQVGIKERFSEKNITVIMDYSSFENSEKKEEPLTIENLSLIYHEPARVIKLQSETFPLCFGYLVFPKTAIVPHLFMKDQAVNDMCKNILNSLHKRIPQIKDVSDNKELQDIIAAMVKGSDNVRTMNIRYIPPNKMQHFCIPSTMYYPYGESIFDTCQFSAKVLIALETALAVHRLSRSTEKRKISVEVGLPRDARKMVEGLKEEFRKRKISLDSFGSIDTIPSMISTFEDIYVPQKDGKPFVDISTFTEGNVDIRGKVDELKYLRDSVVASIGVPASFLNIEENLSNKSALSEENILFARTVVNHQKYLSLQLNGLIQKIYDIISPEDALSILDNVSVTFPPPKSLQFEREARYMSELANLVETLERIGIPKEYSRKRFLTGIDWTDLKNYEIDEKIDIKLGTNPKQDEMGMGGMGGMGGMPSMGSSGMGGTF